ncbi:PilN domain-containing protein [Nibricoccus sp. IMCC34717]|uniref:PilN domain-containing protein n=1 Tax=Nibricoccus sp. IMCC34717 TaxID=3034021 RepID=UPI00384A6AD1
MASLLKRKTDAGPAVPPWHPNFRNEQKLPDVKVIRTSFFVNVGIGILLVASVLWVSYQEYNLSEIRSQIARDRAQIEQDTPAHRKAIQLYQQFSAEEKKARELEAFMTSRPSMVEFVMLLAGVTPQDVAFSSMEISEASVTLKGFISGLPAKASGIASAFERQLRDTPALSKEFPSITLTNLGRDQTSGRMTFTLEMKRVKKKP